MPSTSERPQSPSQEKVSAREALQRFGNRNEAKYESLQSELEKMDLLDVLVDPTVIEFYFDTDVELADGLKPVIWLINYARSNVKNCKTPELEN